MTATNAATAGESTPNVDVRTRVGGAWLAGGALLLVIGLLFHPPPSPNPTEFMATIAEDPTRWVAAHAVTAIALAAFTVAGLLLLTADSRLTGSWWTATAWAVVVVGAIWVTTAAVTEATAITRAAVAGDLATFETWSAFVGPYSAAFAAFALAFAVIAGHEARSGHGTPPPWASWIGAIAGVVAAVGLVLVFGFGIGVVGPVWLASSIVMSLWALWFGVVLARSTDAAWATPERPESGRQEAV